MEYCYYKSRTCDGYWRTTFILKSYAGELSPVRGGVPQIPGIDHYVIVLMVTISPNYSGSWLVELIVYVIVVN